jgi:hypothetical protein
VTTSAPSLERIAELEAAFRSGERGPLERELVTTRRAAVAEVAGVERGPIPAGGTPPPVGDSGLPEATPDQLDGPTVRAAFESHGGLVVRGLVPRSTAEELVAGIDRAIEAWAGLARPFAGPTGDPWFDPQTVDEPERRGLGRTWVTNGAGLLTFDSPRMLATILDRYESLGLRQLLTELLGGRPVLSANKCTLRRVPVDTSSGWHQDGAFLGRQLRAVNVWATLTDCGVDAPGLDIVPRRFDHIVETGTRGAIFDWSVGQELVDELAEQTPIVRPALQAGDAVVFDEMLLHRTATDPSMTTSRYAIEMWTFAGSAYPEGHVALAW